MINIVDRAQEEKITPVLRLGFRPLFLLAGLYAVLSICLWSWMFSQGQAGLSLQVPAIWWHAHEMLFGVAIAVVAGFLLTAVQTWTGVKGTSGARLLFIVSLWIVPRVLFWTDAPLALIALVDAAFLLVVGLEVGYRVIITKRWRNLFFIPMLLVALIANLASYATVKGMPPFSANALWQAMLWWFMLLISIMGGRVIPFFTAKRYGIEQPKPIIWLEVLASFPLILLAILSFFPLVNTWLISAVMAVCGGAQMVRLYRWNGLKSRSEPLVWSLHLFYFALPLGLLLKAAFISNAWASHTLIHLIAMGALGGVILAMIVRVTLGHTGRAIYQQPSFAFGFVSLLVATVIRVAGPILFPAYINEWVVIAAVGWSIAFGAFVLRFGPMLLKARADGHPG
ncbi:NnrS family protein [Enterovibrio sp. ZSDZ35]|uniref:NnrS family protein n=1 Tax=Enterovibrio qingdaonensis TaxID=2899818 RepID=A0ABT5QQ49_9GAMM|nr:NnrS family protein [Enterovibrio sp. ZSDZ35]MDD1782808.1 NnrS family protein [Enterovibrio sp. ZSDZ35]